MSVTCPYCNKSAELVNGLEVYPHRPDLEHKFFWLCRPCDAYVGTHKNSPTHQPLGRLADKNLREWKSMAHLAFDPLWERKMKETQCSKSKARRSSYKWLARKLGIHVKDCHIGHFDVEKCQRIVEICTKKKIELENEDG